VVGVGFTIGILVGLAVLAVSILKGDLPPPHFCGVGTSVLSGTRRNSSNPNVPSDRAKMSTHRSIAGADGLAG